MPPNLSEADQWAAAGAEALQREQKERLRSSIAQAVSTNPDAEAKLRLDARVARVPLDTARNRPDETAAQARLVQFDSADLLARFPNTGRWLAMSPDNARIAHDDVQALQQVETAARALTRTPPTLPAPATPALPPRVALQGPQDQQTTQTPLTLSDIVMDGPFGAVARGGYAALQGLGGAFNKAAQFVNIIGAAPLVLADKVTGGTAAQDWWFRNQVDPLVAQEKTFEVDRDASFGIKAMHMAGGLLGMLSQITLTGGGGTPGVVAATDSVATAARVGAEHGIKAMAFPALSESVNMGRKVYEATGDGTAALNAAIAQWTGTSAMGVVPLSMPGTATARVVSGGISGAVTGEATRMGVNLALPDSMQAPFDWEQVHLSLLAGGLMGGVMGPRPEARQLTPEVRRAIEEAHQAQVDGAQAQALTQLAQAANTSKLRERDPAAFREFVKQQAEGSDMAGVFVGARDLAEVFNQAGVTPEDIRATMPDVARQLDAALDQSAPTNVMVRVPIEDFATHIAGSELEKPFLDRAHTSPEAPTVTEAQTRVKEQADALTKRAEEIGKAREADTKHAESLAAVKSDVQSRLEAIGMRPDIAETNGALLSAFYEVQADRAGMLPHEFAAKYPVRFTNKALDGLAQAKSDQRGAFSPATHTISVLKSADLSTFQHELGHYFLDTLTTIATFTDAPASVKGDVQTLMKWFGVADVSEWREMTLDQQRAHHEKFATGWETYLMKGEAPSFDLRRLFSRFRAWMVSVYRKLSDAPGEFTPEVRGVFDRMIASDEAIAQAEQARKYMPLFDTPERAGMSPEEWTAYQDVNAEATETAIRQLLTTTLRDMASIDRLRVSALKGVQKEAEEALRAIRAEVRGQVAEMPVYRLWTFLRSKGAENSNDTTRGAGKLDFDAVVELAGVDTANALKALNMTRKKGGLDPGVVADMFGFRAEFTPAEMLRMLAEVDPPEVVIDGMSDTRMLERHGEIATPEAMKRAADAAVQNEVRARFLASELTALKRAVGPMRERDPTSGKWRIGEVLRAAKEAAENYIDTQRIRDISEAQHRAAEARSAIDAEKALKKGDTGGAAIAKRDQILNLELARAAREAAAYVKSALDYLSRFDRDSVREKIDLEYRDQIDALLERADLRRSVTNKALDKREALVMFVERMAAQGYKPDIPEHVLAEAERWHYKDMPLVAFKGLVDSVKAIEHLGRLKQTLHDGKETRDINVLADEVAASAARLPQRKRESNRGLSRLHGAWVNAKSAGRSATAAMLKMEQMFDWLDGRDPNGTLNRVVFRRIADAGGRENDMLRKVKHDIDALLAEGKIKDITKEKGRVYAAEGLIDKKTGQPQRFTLKEMLMLAGNMGNESNAAKMAKGEGWDQAEVWRFLHQNMRKEHWDFIAGIGRVLESMWPEKLAMDRRLGNTSPEKIEPRPFDTPHGRYDGWYWPMMYDPARSQDVAERNARSGEALFENIFTKASSDTGRMNTRNEAYARPLLLDLDALPRMIREEIHDITHREAIIDADRFLHHPKVREAVINALGQEYHDQFRPWLQAIAADGKLSSDGVRGMEFFNKVAREARLRATMVGLGFRLSTALVHGTTAALESVSELGVKWMAVGIRDFADPRQWSKNKDFIFERSSEMRNRMNEVDRDVREHLREIDLHLMSPTTGAVARGADLMRAHAYSLIAGLDFVSAVPTWMGAYHKAMTPLARGGLGMGEVDAVHFADKTVRNAHGGTGIKDMARVQRGSEFQKLFTMFYTFWNHNFNRITDTAKLVTSAKHRELMRQRNHWTNAELASTVILRTLAYTIGAQVIHTAFKLPSDDHEPDHWLAYLGKEFAAAMFAGIPIARDISAWALHGKDYQGTPAVAMVESVGRTGVDAMNALTGEEVSDKWLKHSVQTAGYVLNLPLGQPSSTVQFLWDVAQGDLHPETAVEWWRGIAHGDMKKH